jgi:hypothetical protein
MKSAKQTRSTSRQGAKQISSKPLSRKRTYTAFKDDNEMKKVKGYVSPRDEPLKKPHLDKSAYEARKGRGSSANKTKLASGKLKVGVKDGSKTDTEGTSKPVFNLPHTSRQKAREESKVKPKTSPVRERSN